MSNFQEWCVKVLPFIQAAASGEVVQVKPIEGGGSDWVDLHQYPMSFPVTAFDFDNYDYRIKPRTIMIGDIEVPEPMREPMMAGAKYFCPMVSYYCDTIECRWDGGSADLRRLNSGVCHQSEIDAITHAKALIALTANKDASHE